MLIWEKDVNFVILKGKKEWLLYFTVLCYATKIQVKNEKPKGKK